MHRYADFLLFNLLANKSMSKSPQQIFEFLKQFRSSLSWRDSLSASTLHFPGTCAALIQMFRSIHQNQSFWASLCKVAILPPKFVMYEIAIVLSKYNLICLWVTLPVKDNNVRKVAFSSKKCIWSCRSSSDHGHNPSVLVLKVSFTPPHPVLLESL